MKKLIIGTIGSILMMFVIWTIIGYINYGDELINYHLDLNQTIRQINLIFDEQNIGGMSFINIIRSFRDNINKINKNSFVAQVINAMSNNGYDTTTGFGFFLNTITSLFDPVARIANAIIVLVYIPITILGILTYAINFILGIWEFVFSPVFIPIVEESIRMI